jgi:hypothetical protein
VALVAAVLLMGIVVLVAVVVVDILVVRVHFRVVKLGAEVDLTTTEQINLILAVFGKAMDRWLSPTVLVCALHQLQKQPLTVMSMLPSLQESRTPVAAAEPWKHQIFH